MVRIQQCCLRGFGMHQVSEPDQTTRGFEKLAHAAEFLVAAFQKFRARQLPEESRRERSRTPIQ